MRLKFTPNVTWQTISHLTNQGSPITDPKKGANVGKADMRNRSLSEALGFICSKILVKKAGKSDPLGTFKLESSTLQTIAVFADELCRCEAMADLDLALSWRTDQLVVKMAHLNCQQRLLWFSWTSTNLPSSHEIFLKFCYMKKRGCRQHKSAKKPFVCSVFALKFVQLPFDST